MEEKKRIQYMLKIEDEQILNHTYAEEEYLWQLVREGNVEDLSKVLNTSMPRYPQVIENDRKKNEEYMAVSSISILSRIAIQCGITSTESFFVSDIYLKAIASSKTIDSIMRTVMDAHIEYADMIRRHNASKSTNMYVENCKRDIIKNLYNCVSLSDIAKDLGIRASYLSRLFKEYEGITVTDYIHKEKIHLAKNMLSYSDRTIAEISDYLKFNSQSYFGKLFKRHVGITPKEYRNRYHAPEF